MKILFLSAWFPYPPDNGSRIRVYNLMKALAREHKVYLISLLQDDSRRENADKLSDICEVVSLHESRWFSPRGVKSVLGFFSSRPRSAVSTYDRAVHQAVRNAIVSISPDLIAVSTLGVAEYVDRGCGVPMVLDEHNCEYAVLRRSADRTPGKLKQLRYALGWKKYARWESMICAAFDAVAMVSDDDKRMILDAASGLSDVRVIPNGVDVDHYDPGVWEPQSDTLLYNGALTYGANLDAVRYYVDRIYPLLSSRLPDVRLLVTGRTGGVDLTGIGDCPGVERTGYVQDIRDVLKKSAACVVPLREGGGSRLKILEAMAAGVPVVSTSMGAEGINAVSGTHLLIADTPEAFADAIVRVLEDNELRSNLRSAARSLVEQYYSWESIGAEFVDMVESVVRRRGASEPTGGG